MTTIQTWKEEVQWSKKDSICWNSPGRS